MPKVPPPDLDELIRRVRSQRLLQVLAGVFWWSFAIFIWFYGPTSHSVPPAIGIVFISGWVAGLVFYFILLRELGQGRVWAGLRILVGLPLADLPTSFRFLVWLVFRPPHRPQVAELAPFLVSVSGFVALITGSLFGR